MRTSLKATHRKRREIIKNTSHKRLQTNLRLLAIVYIILLFVAIYHVFTTPVIWWQVLLCIIIGLTVGTISSRMMKIDWDKDQEKVVGRMDIYGVIILVLFILFEIFRTHIVALFAGSSSIGTLSLLLLAFTLYGRIAGMAKRILVVANEQL